jgi:hypothetical protein
MAYTEITTGDAGKFHDAAIGFANAAKNDPNDPASENLMRAIDNYFTAIGIAQNEMVRGLNDILERVDRIETLLKTHK